MSGTAECVDDVREEMDLGQAERVAKNESVFRNANERIEQAASEYGIPDRIPFICECADPSCRALALQSRDEYEEIRSDPTHFMCVPGHEAAAQGWGEVVARSDRYVVIRKVDRAGEVAAELDGRP